SVATALDVLDCLADEPELGVSELGRRLGISKSTAHRLVTTLCQKGYLQQVPDTRSYRLGIRLHELGETVASRSPLRDRALPLLESLRNQTGETVHLAVPEGNQMFYVERLESYQGLRFSSRVGRLRPIHLTSSGKAVAAFNPTVAEAACANEFERRTPRTIRTKEQFLRCLAETRARGYAYSIEEDEPGLASVAAPVLDRTGIARAAISVAGPAARIAGEHMNQTARRVRAAAAQLMSVESVWWSGTGFR
ncbi:MAG TPA: IclR family transcriptional regulator, partial [Mycobacteriales bacterium]|nr:IclR family transcriptional regulator [Mycobacteriales bacterium]